MRSANSDWNHGSAACAGADMAERPRKAEEGEQKCFSRGKRESPPAGGPVGQSLGLDRVWQNRLLARGHPKQFGRHHFFSTSFARRTMSAKGALFGRPSSRYFAM